MALAAAVQGGRLPAQLITWQHQDNTVEDLTGATLTGKILLQRQQAAQSITGTLTVTDATNGVFRWSYSADDVAYVPVRIACNSPQLSPGFRPKRLFRSG